MAVFRVERNGNYTVMANYHLKDRNLSLKAKGLLSVFLSLPDRWDYTLKGLARICKEGIDAIRAALQELITAGYVICSRIRNTRGQLKGTEYVIYEKPQPDAQAELGSKAVSEDDESAPVFSSPVLAEPVQEKPELENPTLEHPTQLNNISNSGSDISYSVGPKINKNINKQPTEENHHPSHPSMSPAAWVCQMPNRRTDRMVPLTTEFSFSQCGEPVSWEELHQTRQTVKDQISYAVMAEEYGRGRIDEIVNLMVSVLTSSRAFYTFDGTSYPAEHVKEQFGKVTKEHIEYVFGNLNQTHSNIRNPMAYLTKCLYNATMSMNNHMDAKAREAMHRIEEREKKIAEEEEIDRIINGFSPEFWEETRRRFIRSPATSLPASSWKGMMIVT